MADYDIEQLGEDLRVLIKSGLVDVSIKENGEWLFKAVDGVSELSPEEILKAINSVLDSESE
jgi:hypothetical protein